MGQGPDMTGHPSDTLDTLDSTSLVELSVHRLGERTCVINVGTDLRHSELPLVEDAIGGVVLEHYRDLVFDLTFLRRYETFALARMGRQWERLASLGCAIHVAARDASVVAELERLGGVWELHPSGTRALRALLSTPLG